VTTPFLAQIGINPTNAPVYHASEQRQFKLER
jgi:hypothetical protein